MCGGTAKNGSLLMAKLDLSFIDKSLTYHFRFVFLSVASYLCEKSANSIVMLENENTMPWYCEFVEWISKP